MAALRFATTRLSGLRAAGRLQEMQHATIAPFLERELGPAYGRLFADFEAESSDVRAWYVDMATPPRRIDTLSPAEQDAVRERLAQMIADVLKLAERMSGESVQKANVARVLIAATTFPIEDVWAVGDQPVIVNWGFHRTDVAEGVPRPIMMRIERLASTPAAARPTATAAIPQAPAAGVAVAAPRPPRPAWLLPSILWLAFLAMVVVAYRLMLPACALRGSLFSPLDACPGGARQTALAEEGRDLQGLVEQAELDLARRKGLCPVPQPTTFSPVPTQIPTPATPELRHDIEQRLPPSAPRGDVEVSLIWNNAADLDLIIDCPNGERLWRASPDLAACGGRLMSDLNRAGEPLTENPVERAAWTHSPGGLFSIRVELYAYNTAPDGIEIPFTIAIKRPSGTDIVQGKVQGVHSLVTATTAAL